MREHEDGIQNPGFNATPPGFDPSRITDDLCPVCPGELDTGWECNSCGFDARLIALTDGETKQ
jgi:hypothetical protein